MKRKMKSECDRLSTVCTHLVRKVLIQQTQTQTTVRWLPEEEEVEGRRKREKGVKYMVTEADFGL